MTSGQGNSLDPNSAAQPGPSAGERRRSSLFEVAPPPRQRGMSHVFHSNLEMSSMKPKSAGYSTYRLEVPVKFPIGRATDLLKDELHKAVKEVTQYEPDQAKKLAKDLATKVRIRLANMRVKRYRFVVNIHVGQKENASLFIGSRFIWNYDQDNWTSYRAANAKLFIVAEVYAVSQE